MEWFEDEDFWRDLYPAMFPPDRFEVADQQVNQIVELIRFEGATILDMCCGPGRHSTSFARRGFKVTGVDLSEFLLERARGRAAEFGVEAEWIREDMRRFHRPKAFDLACSLFTSFGYFEDEQDDLKVLRNVRDSLVPNGIFVIEILGKERLARVWQNSQCNQLPDGSLVVQRPEVRADWTRVRNEWILIKDGHTKSFHFEHTVYSGRELKDRLLQAGFGEVALYGDLEGKPYGLDANRLVAVARNT
jgi:SAM-dependent methyltransferase